MAPFDSPSNPSSQPLNEAFHAMTLEGGRQAGGGGLLQDDDLSLALDMGGLGDGGDDSFDLLSSQGPPMGGAFGEAEDETVRLGVSPSSAGGEGGLAAAKGQATGTSGSRTGRGTEIDGGFAYGGSMAPQAVPASRQFDPFSSTLPPNSASASSAADSSPLPSTSRSSAATSAAVSTSLLRQPGAEDEEEEDDELDVSAFSEEDQARIKALRFERDGLKGMNRTLEGLRGALGRMEGKVASFASSISTTHSLLDLYSRIASQAEHTKELLLDGEWRGVEADYDLLATRQAAEEQARLREEQEAEERRERERREREEAVEAARRRAADQAARAADAPRGRGRGVLRGSSISSRGRVSSTLSSTRGRGGLSSISSSSSSIPSPTTRSSANISSTSTSTSGIPTASGASTRGSAPVSGVRGVRGLRSRVATAGARGGRGGVGRGGAGAEA
ncbi:hypothetical protein JCM11251_001794 [Rhodosporidiobolus azoricus]